MKTVNLKMGREVLTLNIPDKNVQDILHGVFPPEPTPEEEREAVVRSLREPIGSKPLRELAKPGQKVVIMASDITPGLSLIHI